MEYKRSVCPHDCPDTCGLLVGVENGRVTSVKGDPEHPFTRGAVCVKMRYYPKRQYSPLRVLHPQRRIGPKGSGRFERITWDEALDEIVDRYRRIIDEYGAEAILPYSYAGTMGLVHFNGGHAFFHKIGASKLLRTICSSALEAGYNASLGPVSSAAIETAADSDLVVIWGSNTLTTNMHAWPFFLQARRRGAPIVVIDPYKNRTAGRADRHIKIRPGTDAALALGVMHVLIRDDLIDHDFIRDQTIGFDDLKERVKEYPAERTAEITAVPVEDIEYLAGAYGRAQAPYIRLGWGPGRQLGGGMAVRTVCLLPALVGAFYKKGGSFTRSISVGPALNTTAVTREDLAPPGVRTVNMVELGNALTEPADPPVAALHVYHSNPAAVAPESGKILEGLARDDLFTVVHEHLMTDTARYADILLPAATSLESTDLYRSYGHHCIQMTRPVVAPLGEARPTLAIFQELAGRFGFSEDVFTATEEDLIGQLLRTDSPLFEGVTMDRVRECRPVRVNTPENPYLDGFGTPSGKVEFFSKTLADQGLDPLPDGMPLEDEDGDGRYPLRMITPPRHEFLNSTFNEVDELRQRAGRPGIKIHPDDAGSRNISDGGGVRVFNGRGRVFLYAEVTDDTLPGVTVVEGIYWPRFMPDGLGVNQLTSQALTDLGGSCAFHCNRVEVEPAEF